jgi:hypothetical protein
MESMGLLDDFGPGGSSMGDGSVADGMSSSSTLVPSHASTEDDYIEIGTWVSDGKFDMTPLLPMTSKAFKKNKRAQAVMSPRRPSPEPQERVRPTALLEPAITIEGGEGAFTR